MKMANIKVSIDYPISDGTKLKFRTPCESTEVEGLVVRYPVRDGVGNAVKTFRFVDAHGTELSGIGNVFTSDVLIEVLLDVTKGRAFIKNADTNSYIEDIKVTVKRMEEERQVIFAEVGKSIEDTKATIKDANEVISKTTTVMQGASDAAKRATDAANKLNHSAYQMALENGFEGTPEEWLVSLRGDKGDKGDKGDRGPQGDGVNYIDGLNDITEAGIYKVDGAVYVAKAVEWDTDLSKPFKYIGEGAIPVFDFNQGDIAISGGDGLGGAPLLKYANHKGNHDGATYLFLRIDNESFNVYVSDSAGGTAEFLDNYSFIGDDALVDLSSLAAEEYAVGLGEDIYGNWAKIKQYFVAAELDIQKLLTEADKVKDALTATIEDNVLVVSSEGTTAHAEIKDNVLILK